MSYDNLHQAAQLLNDAHHEFVIITWAHGKRETVSAEHICDLNTLKAFKSAARQIIREQKKRIKQQGGCGPDKQSN